MSEAKNEVKNEAKSEAKKVLYIVVKRPDPKFDHKWQGSRLLELHLTAVAIKKIEKYRTERMFVKIPAKREILCSVMVDEVKKKDDGNYLVTFKDIRQDHWVIPGEVKSFAGGFCEGIAPLPVPLN